MRRAKLDESDRIAVDLDEACGARWRFRDLVECGETWQRARGEPGAGNVPRRSATLDGFRSVCRELLDPVAKAFGEIELTYAFASAWLARRVPGRIAPQLDQHAGSETRADGRLICERDGQAVDFRVVGTSSLEVARWVARGVPFDRMYFYGPDRPLHVSVGPQDSRSIVVIRTTETGRRVPLSVSLADFLQG